ncbi:MAG TPA: hypothetical protein VNE41_08695 [Chitinophagaceae bacterium]|nr:hypothetical protein [Chitinophagaceae bacterium]
MTIILLIAFIISLIHLSVSKRLKTYVSVLAFQGILLFGAAFIELIRINLVNLLFILLETIVIKSIAIPYFLNYLIRRNKITRESEPYLPDFISLVIVTAIIFGSFLLSGTMYTSINRLFFMAAFSGLFTGLYFIISRKKIITHVMGFLVMENGVFALTLAAGAQMPMLVNAGILLDIFASVLLLGIFVNKIGGILKEQEAGQLRNLKD